MIVTPSGVLAFFATAFFVVAEPGIVKHYTSRAF